MTLRLDVLAPAEWAGQVAADLAEAIAHHPDLRLCLPTGSTPVPVYDRLPAALAARSSDASRATVVLLDEYLDLPPGHVARCDATLRRLLLDWLVPPPAFIAFSVDAASDPLAVCRATDAAVAAAGGLDLAIVGLGINGHVGMNEPGTPPDAPTRPVELAPTTIEAARRYGADPPPRRGVTIGLGSLLAAWEIWLLARGARKASILAQALEGPETADCPASLLRAHPRLRVIADAPAASALGPRSQRGTPRPSRPAGRRSI